MERVHLARAPQKLRIFFLLQEGDKDKAVAKSNEVCGYDMDRDQVWEKKQNSGAYIYTPREEWLQSWTSTIVSWADEAHVFREPDTGMMERLLEALRDLGIVVGWTRKVGEERIQLTNDGLTRFRISVNKGELGQQETIARALTILADSLNKLMVEYQR